jgi:hypothetical protein
MAGGGKAAPRKSIGNINAAYSEARAGAESREAVYDNPEDGGLDASVFVHRFPLFVVTAKHILLPAVPFVRH